MLWIGLILLAIGVPVFLSAGRAGDRALYAQATETSNVGDVLSLVAEVRSDMAELGGGTSGYAHIHEFKGRVVCDSPLTGEFSGRPAAIVNTRVERDVETLRESTDARGNETSRWVRSTETMSSNRQETVFFVEDASGRLRVDPSGGKLALTDVVNRFEQPQAVESAGGGQATVSISGFSVSVPAKSDTSDRRTLGYRFVEEALPIGQHLYVYGEVVDTADDGLVVRKPGQEDRPFILSTQGEERLVAAAKSSAGSRRWIGIALAVAGAALVVAGVVTG